MDSISVSSESPIDFHFEADNDDESDTLSDMELPTEFLNARTKSFPRDTLGSQDHPMNWDNYVVASAAGCSSPVEHMDTADVERGCQVSDICEYLLNVFSDFGKYTRFLGYNGNVAQDLLDLLQKLLDHAPLEPRFRAVLYVALVRLCRKSGLYPRCFSLEDVNVNLHDLPLSNGGFGEVYRANYNGEVVCAKVVRMYQSSNQAFLHKSFSREAVVWGQLSHPNILPFYGIHRLNDPRRRLCLISPWMTNGNVSDFLTTRPHLDRTPFVHDVVSGIEYLHENGVVHGDLKSLNILVTDSERACLADFGLSYVTDASGLKGHLLSSNHAEGGTAGFEAPELVDPDNEFSRRTKASDIYAFGMVCYEMFTGERPFSKVKPVALITRIMRGQHPEKPRGEMYEERGLTDDVWSLMKRCWNRLPDDRPTIAQIKQCLPRLELEWRNEEWTRSSRPGFDSTSGQVDVTLTSALPHLKSLVI
ncbi:Light-sensor Protein kinase [Termitomyces sp. T112]|nr:Light-sensor Protein kinase [Termitomyces sp. T112]